MKLLTDREIKELAEKGMLSPFVPEKRRARFSSFGLGSFGYDVRVADEFAVLRSAFLDPAGGNPEYEKFRAEEVVIPPGSFVLCRTVEYFKMPPDVVGLGFGKSTYARMGIFTNVTPLEPGWEGYLTVAVNNLSGVPFRLPAGEGICQILFFRGEEPEATYAERGGKYHKQREVLGAIGE